MESYLNDYTTEHHYMKSIDPTRSVHHHDSDYNNLQINSHTTLSDSGTIFEEASILNFRALNIRESHERPEGFDSGVLIMTGLNKQSILSSIKITINNFNKSTNRQIPDFEQEDVSQKIMKIIISYIPYIKENTWKIKQ